MPNLVLLFLTLFFYIKANSQPAQDYYNSPSTLKPFYLSLEIKKKDRVAASNFNKIEFIDGRSDSLLMGFVSIEVMKPPQRISIKNSAENYLRSKMYEALSPGPVEKTIVIKLNDIWFNQTITQAGWLEGTLLGPEKRASNLFFNADVLVHEGGNLKKIGNIDSCFSKKGWLPNNCDELLQNAIVTTIKYSDQCCEKHFADAVSVPSNQIDSIKRLNASFAILRNENRKKGIYFSYTDFLNDAPTALPFETKEGFRKVFLKYKQANDTTSDKAWGFNDGHDIYMHIDSGYYKLRFTDYSFSVYAPETIEIINTFFSKIVYTAGWYSVYDPPFKLLAAEPFLKPGRERQTYFRVYFLNILNGSLR